MGVKGRTSWSRKSILRLRLRLVLQSAKGVGSSMGKLLGVKNIVFVSYWSGSPGLVMSEWAEDKLKAFEKMGFNVLLITSTLSSHESTSSRRIIKVPSLGKADFASESNSNLGAKKTTGGLRSRALQATVKVLSLTVGRIFDAVFLRLAGSYSDGKWSWFFCAAPVAFVQAIKHRGSVVFSTGGPSVAHLVALVAAKLSGREFVCEAQDPLLGSEMQMSERARRALLRLERNLAKSATKLIFVTKAAQSAARSRHPTLSSKIVSVYPGAFDFGIKHITNESLYQKDKIVMAHLGHLYGSRNLDLLFLAIDQMIAAGEIPSGLIQMRNIGPAYVSNRDEYLARTDYQELPLGNRQDGLREASKADFLLLVQHSDSRSRETIPYKTYDYLNLGAPIFGVINNPELAELVKDRGFVGSAKDIDSTKQAIRKMVDFHRSLTDQLLPIASPISFQVQVENLFR